MGRTCSVEGCNEKHRKYSEYTLVEISQWTGLSTSTVRNYFSHQNDASDSTLCKMDLFFFKKKLANG